MWYSDVRPVYSLLAYPQFGGGVWEGGLDFLDEHNFGPNSQRETKKKKEKKI